MSKNKDNFTDLLAGMENDAAKLAVIAGIITTLGDVLATIAAIMALEEAQKSNNNNNNNNNSNKIDELEKQVQYLTKELHKLKHSRKV
ncbi:hypothetical protein FCT18_05800 [Lysinibacillus sphaericus]|uniref:Translation initiation factor 2 n=1 Tax=Lysinibacillus sphaericus TaxID=1421 RepID=A0A2S0K121_LYSSH|nr:hypothetical protein [Lysinibacillus sphaericus]AVK97103.1 hypothetical protein LS41612_12940 [Lysinibacillus sphaericus]MED4542386.1 hypothetical protein [Lysinibacillus sphaericus]TKI20376.1 hypothetical protein FCT18_05800 [Lysinibacillus sphaericus]SUV17033.1 Uncharacterised protein [Lysinibacillus sphaericus]GEC83645.1 hypothetical protein LSP03_33880 [Lysinibacillus sphaericus]